MHLETIQPRGIRRWIVAATGPSLTEEVVALCRGEHVLAVNDAYRRFPQADVLYACDNAWWKVHHGCPLFKGEKWTTHNKHGNNKDGKEQIADTYGLRCVKGADGDVFSMDPRVILYGSCSGFQAINLALLFGALEVLLVGFDMRSPTMMRRHFFGNHPAPLRNTCKYEAFIPMFNEAARKYKGPATIINCTPDSALKCWPHLRLVDALRPPRQVVQPEPCELGYA